MKEEGRKGRRLSCMEKKEEEEGLEVSEGKA